MTFGAVAHNVGHLSFGNSDNCPRDQLPEYDIGFLSTTKIWPSSVSCLPLIFETLPTLMQTTPIAMKTKAALDVFRKDSIGVGNLVFLPIDSGANFVSVRGGVSQNQTNLGC